MERQQELAAALQDIFDLIDTGQLLRNTSFDGHPDWVNRMTNFVMVLGRAKALLEPDPKEPAVVKNVIAIEDWTQCFVCRPDSGKSEHLCPTHFAEAVSQTSPVPGGCVSIPDPVFEQQQEILQTLSEKFQEEPAQTLEFERSVSEQLQEDLEPISDHGKRYCI